MKKNLFSAFLVMALVLSMGTALYAASGTHRYSNGYTVTYSLAKQKVNNANGAYAATWTKSNVQAVVSLIVYNSSGEIIATKGGSALQSISTSYGNAKVKRCGSAHTLKASGLESATFTLSVTY